MDILFEEWITIMEMSNNGYVLVVFVVFFFPYLFQYKNIYSSSKIFIQVQKYFTSTKIVIPVQKYLFQYKNIY